MGKSTPLHFTRAYPCFKSNDYGFNSPTNIGILDYAFNKAKSEGLEYVYLGNILNNKAGNTYCPNCGVLAIKRVRFSINILNLDKEGKCIQCGHLICRR